VIVMSSTEVPVRKNSKEKKEKNSPSTRKEIKLSGLYIVNG